MQLELLPTNQARTHAHTLCMPDARVRNWMQTHHAFHNPVNGSCEQTKFNAARGPRRPDNCSTLASQPPTKAPPTHSSQGESPGAATVTSSITS